jgi:hypothetical protein
VATRRARPRRSPRRTRARAVAAADAADADRHFADPDRTSNGAPERVDETRQRLGDDRGDGVPGARRLDDDQQHAAPLLREREAGRAAEEIGRAQRRIHAGTPRGQPRVSAAETG